MPKIHLAAAYESTDQAIGNLAWLATGDGETLLDVSGDDLKVPRDMPFVLGAYVASATLERARLVTPSLRPNLWDFTPLNRGGVEPLSPTPIVDRFRNPVPLTGGEKCNLQIENDGAAAAEDVVGLVWLADGPPSPDSGPYVTVRATTTASAMTAFDWNARTLTLDNDLREGRWQLLGLHAVGTSLIAARVVRRDGAERPGVLCYDSVADLMASPFAPGAMGVLTEFDHDNPPQIEFLPGAADNESQEVFLHIRRVGA